MFCTNPRKPTVIHNILADVVETCGGSRQLLRILNRLGCVSSSDTHDRFVSLHAQRQRESDIWSQLSSLLFTIASVDNFDMLQSYSAVHSGSLHRNYHGTTVQLVQPKPSCYLHSGNSTSQSTVTNGQYSSDNYTTNTSDTSNRQPRPVLSDPNHRRRRTTHSPSSSPHKLGKKGPKQRRTVTVSELPSRSTPLPESDSLQGDIYQHLTIENFELTAVENTETSTLNSSLFNYMLLKMAMKNDSINLSDIRKFLQHNDPSQFSSHIHYMEMINENPDSEETMLHVAEELLEVFEKGEQEWVVLVRDGKTYEHLTNLKRHYGESLKKLLIFPGDWHTLKNFQSVLVKVYFAAGLGDIAKVTGYRGTTLLSLQKCGNFKRTHAFLLQVWEALYRVQLDAYLLKHNKEQKVERIYQVIKSCVDDELQPIELLNKVKSLTNGMETEFYQFVEDQGKNDITWNFWGDFLFKNCYSYILLYLALRGSNWNLQIAGLKMMVPMMAAFDRNVYQRIIPNHLADILIYPKQIMEFLSSGRFTVHISGEHWRSVALDEAHEMCINKDMKGAIT